MSDSAKPGIHPRQGKSGTFVTLSGLNTGPSPPPDPEAPYPEAGPNGLNATCTIAGEEFPCHAFDPLTGEANCEMPALEKAMLGEGPMPIIVKVEGEVVNGDADNVFHTFDYQSPDEEELADEYKKNEYKYQDNFISRFRRTGPGATLLEEMAAECVGVSMIAIFGVGSVCTAVLTGAQQGLWQVAVVWGFGVSLAIYCTASISGAHLNPAVSFALAIFRTEAFPWRKLLPFWFAQYLGGVIGGAFNLLWFNEAFKLYETRNNITRGEPNSIFTAACFGEYFPNPGFYDVLPPGSISVAKAFFIEAWGTGILMFVILALTDPRHKIFTGTKPLAPFFIGFTVAVLISLYAPLTQAGWNPARDFGPRLVAAMAGWGKVAIPGPENGFWLYIVAPHLGTVLAAAFYDVVMARGLAPTERLKED